jgi:Coenzyme PQQ synthesis protein D (PqqD)
MQHGRTGYELATFVDMRGGHNVTSYRRSPSVLSVQHGVDAVLLDIAHDQYFSLNPVGARCWALIGDYHSIDAVVDVMVGEFGISAEILHADVMRFVNEMVECRLVVSET